MCILKYYSFIMSIWKFIQFIPACWSYRVSQIWFFFFFYCLLMEQFNLLLLLLHFLQIGNQIQRPEWTQVQSLWQYYTWCFILSLEDTIISVWFLLFYDFNCWWGSRPRSTYYWRFQNCDVLSFCFHISWNDFINRNLPMCINWLLIHIK